MGTQEHSVRLDTCEADVQSAVLEWREQLLKDQKFSVKRVNSLSNDLRRFIALIFLISATIARDEIRRRQEDAEK